MKMINYPEQEKLIIVARIGSKR